MNRGAGASEGVALRVPRTRGDEPRYYELIAVAALRSPHTRG